MCIIKLKRCRYQSWLVKLYIFILHWPRRKTHGKYSLLVIYNINVSRFTTDTCSGIQIVDNDWRWCDLASRDFHLLITIDSIALTDIALPELNDDRVRSRICEHHIRFDRPPFIYPSNPIIITRRTAIQSGFGRPKRIHCHANCRTRPSPLLIYEISCTHHEFLTGARTRVSRQLCHALDQMSIIKRSRPAV